ncbi:hypothetical protein W97_03525 [Coniosporium apollinis CBS 100218]|uniref:Symplekin/Pta1 N-terminal domain-containing protein n=1 Tax=Coniosporium apollinis (strain CBS 100218) TaxID=1168221 RepID=R7YR61_CONA1|nr:uncharacterized protein W97_03525 [Coniosporium apollinis CBS 100218]EON64294.1 hypothetical protein W97_03525 [Coniosporium apollinis CBS 100218]
MASTSNGTADTLAQLNSARDLALKDASYYLQIVPAVLALVGPPAGLDIRRWGAEFLAEAFASPSLAAERKQELSLTVLDLLKEYLDTPGEDVVVVKSVVQAAASIYPLVFRHIIYNPTNTATWQKMTAIKSSILRRMDSAPPGVRICCIKFVQRVVQTQTPGLIADPRRPEHNEISLALVPRDHPIIPPSNLEAETSGLLDRLLGILQEDISDPLLITATLNSLGSLTRSRASIATKIISTVLNFNPFRLVKPPVTTKMKVVVRSIERTTRALLQNFAKKNQNHALVGRIGQHIEHLHHARVAMFDDNNRKRPAPVEPTDGLDQAKRQRLGAEVTDAPSQAQEVLPPPGSRTYAWLFNRNPQEASANFDVKAITPEIVANIVLPLLIYADKAKFDHAINATQARLLAHRRDLPARTALDAAVTATHKPPADEDEEEYEPDFPPAETTEQILNRLDNAPPDELPPERPPPEVALGPFKFPQPPPLTEAETIDCSKDVVNRVFGVMAELDETPASKAQRPGFNRLAASGYDRDAWVTVITRIATRGAAGLENGIVKAEGEGERSIARYKSFSISNTIRDALYLYVIEDFRRRIDVAISWLNEEWYNDRIMAKHAGDAGPPVKHYDKWVLKVLDGIVPYLDAKDKVLIRFLSEIPGIGVEVLDRVKKLARDPERVSLAVNAIHYLVLVRPPVRELCVDALEDLWRNYDDARGPTAKVLNKWRPHVLQEVPNGIGAQVKSE